MTRHNTHPAKHSDTLAHGMAKETLWTVNDMVNLQAARLGTMLRRKAATQTSTKKGAKKLLISINNVLKPIAVTSMSLDKQREKSLLTAWLLPNCNKVQMTLSSHIVEQNKDGISSIRVSPSLTINYHALARLMQRDDVGDLQWNTIKGRLQPTVALLWPIVLAHKGADHKQFALPAANGLFVGSFDETGMPVVKTYLAGDMMTRWAAIVMLHNGLINMAHDLAKESERILPELDEDRRLIFVLQSCALGLGTSQVNKLATVMQMELEHTRFNWLKRDA